MTASITGTTMTVTGTRMPNPLALGQWLFGHANILSDTLITVAAAGGGIGEYTLSKAVTNPIASTTIRINGGIHLYDGLHSDASGILVVGNFQASGMTALLAA